MFYKHFVVGQAVEVIERGWIDKNDSVTAEKKRSGVSILSEISIIFPIFAPL
jgi:hypothetical protein